MSSQNKLPSWAQSKEDWDRRTAPVLRKALGLALESLEWYARQSGGDASIAYNCINTIENMWIENNG